MIIRLILHIKSYIIIWQEVDFAKLFQKLPAGYNSQSFELLNEEA